jgi:hypothetical protein
MYKVFFRCGSACVFFFLYIFFFFVFLCVFVDGSLWVNNDPWETQLDASGLLYFSCKLWCCFYFIFAVVLGYASEVGFLLLFSSFITGIGFSVILVDCWSVVVRSR